MTLWTKRSLDWQVPVDPSNKGVCTKHAHVATWTKRRSRKGLVVHLRLWILCVDYYHHVIIVMTMCAEHAYWWTRLWWTWLLLWLCVLNMITITVWWYMSMMNMLIVINMLSILYIVDDDDMSWHNRAMHHLSMTSSQVRTNSGKSNLFQSMSSIYTIKYIIEYTTIQQHI